MPARREHHDLRLEAGWIIESADMFVGQCQQRPVAVRLEVGADGL
jgi:hypothetical protein